MWSCRDESCPYHDRAVLRAASNDMIIMRTPVDVQHRARVTAHCWVNLVYTASLRDRRHVCHKQNETSELKRSNKPADWHLLKGYFCQHAKMIEYFLISRIALWLSAQRGPVGTGDQFHAVACYNSKLFDFPQQLTYPMWMGICNVHVTKLQQLLQRQDIMQEILYNLINPVA